MMLGFYVADIYGKDDEGNELDEELANQLFIVGIAMIALMNRAMINE